MECVTALSALGRLRVTTPAAPRRSNKIPVSLTAASIERRQISRNREQAERAAAPMQPPPLHDQTTCLLCGLRRRRRLQYAIGRHDDEHRVGPRREDQRRTKEPAPVISEKKRCDTEQAGQHCGPGLLDGAAL